MPNTQSPKPINALLKEVKYLHAEVAYLKLQALHQAAQKKRK